MLLEDVGRSIIYSLPKPKCTPNKLFHDSYTLGSGYGLCNVTSLWNYTLHFVADLMRVDGNQVAQPRPHPGRCQVCGHTNSPQDPIVHMALCCSCTIDRIFKNRGLIACDCLKLPDGAGAGS